MIFEKSFEDPLDLMIFLKNKFDFKAVMNIPAEFYTNAYKEVFSYKDKLKMLTRSGYHLLF